MPRCPNCDYRSETITDFTYAHYPYSDDEGHGLSPDRDETGHTYLVCPDCNVVIG